MVIFSKKESFFDSGYYICTCKLEMIRINSGQNLMNFGQNLKNNGQNLLACCWLDYEDSVGCGAK